MRWMSKALCAFAACMMLSATSETVAQASRLSWALQFSIWAAKGPIPGDYKGQVAYVEFAPYTQKQCEQLGKDLLKKFYSPQNLRATYNCNPND